MSMAERINTDDPAFWRITVTEVYSLSARPLHFTLDAGFFDYLTQRASMSCGTA